MTQTPITPPPANTSGPSQENPFDRAMTWLRSCGVTRDDQEKWGAGVASGIAHRLGVDPIVVRAAFVALAVFGGFGITLYLAGWALLPNRAGEIVVDRAVRDHDGGSILVLIALALFLFGGPAAAGDRPWFGFGWLLPVAVIGFLIHRRRGLRGSHWSHRGEQPIQAPASSWPTTYTPGHVGTEADETPADPVQAYAAPRDYVAEARQRAAEATAKADARTQARLAAAAERRARRRRGPGFPLFLVALGVVGIAYGLGYVVHGAFGDALTGAQVSAFFALGAIGLVLVGLGLAGRRAGVLFLTALLIAGHAASTFWADDLRWSDGVGDRVFTPTAAEPIQTYRLGAGDSTLDLRQLSTVSTSPANITIDQGIGDVTVEVPAGLDVQVNTSVKVGDLTIDGQDSIDMTQNNDHTWTSSSAAAPDAIVNVDLSVGSVHIEKVN